MKWDTFYVDTSYSYFIPIVKSDGYYAFMVLLNKYNLYKDKRKEFAEDFIRGMITKEEHRKIILLNMETFSSELKKVYA